MSDFLLGIVLYGTGGFVFGAAVRSFYPEEPLATGIGVAACLAFMWTLEGRQRRRDDKRWHEAIWDTRRRGRR